MILFAHEVSLNRETIFDFAIVGGGLVGLSTARSLHSQFPDAKILLLEKETQVAQHQSGRNSGVLHSGIYYKPGSLKGDLVARGRELLLAFCEENAVSYELCGKLILALAESEFLQLEKLAVRGKKNRLEIHILSLPDIKKIEPSAIGLRALWIPQAGIIDFVEVAKIISKHLVEKDVQVQLGTAVIDIQNDRKEVTLVTDQGHFQTRFAVNCAGLFSDLLARKSGVNPGLRIIPFRGEYYRLKPRARNLVRGLIYPLANPKLPFLGVHLTRTTNGEVLVGPNAVLAFKREGYRPSDFDLSETFNWMSYWGFWQLILANAGTGLGEMLKAWSISAFTKATQKLVPTITTRDLEATRAGVRAQAVDTRGRLIDDFRFVRSENWLHVLNAPSPAATACLAIGERITQQIAEAVN